MSSLIVRTTKLLDREILVILSQLLEWFSDGEATVYLPAAGSLNFETSEDVESYECSPSSRVFIGFYFKIGSDISETVAFQRGVVDEDTWRQNPNRNGFNRRQPSAYFDELALLDPSPGVSAGTRLADGDIVRISDLLNNYAAPFDASSDDEARRLSKVVSKQINELRSLHLEMASGLVAARAKSEEEFAKRQADLEEGFSKRLALIDEREADLERRRTELNDREPQHERRRLREHLTARLQTTITEPRLETGRRERFAHYLYLVAAVAFVGISVMLAASSDFTSQPGSADFWARSMKSLVSGIAGAAFAWAGLSGLKASAVAARDYEQAILRYAFDMDRASWIVETILQMNSAEQADVPEEWLEAVCRDLFISSGQKPDERKSLEAFAALFDATAKARIGTNGLEFEIDRKGARKLAEQ